MTSRERVLATLNHQEPDRIPIDLGGFQTGIHREAYRELIAHLGYDEKILILDPVQQIVRPSERVLERFRVDTRYISAHAPESFKGGIVQNWRAGRLWHDLRDEFGVVWSMPDDEPNYMDISRHPLAGATKADLADYPFPNGADPTRFSGVREEALRLRRETPFALATGISGVVYEVCWYMRGLEQWFEDLIERPEFCEALLDRVLAYWLDFETGFMKAVGDIADVVMIGDDLAGQDGPLFSPDLYRRLVKPRQKKLVRHLRSLTRAKIWFHTCGDASVLIPELIDNGIDVLNPVQVGLKGMAPQSLKARYGKDLAFWGGGIDAQHVLPFASPAEVRNAVRKNMGAFKPGGGYVFNNVHNIQKGVPPANIVALFDAAYEFGRYGA
jgi:uroporphyrinogen decarboxylase